MFTLGCERYCHWTYGLASQTLIAIDGEWKWNRNAFSSLATNHKKFIKHLKRNGHIIRLINQLIYRKCKNADLLSILSVLCWALHFIPRKNETRMERKKLEYIEFRRQVKREKTYTRHIFFAVWDFVHHTNGIYIFSICLRIVTAMSA